MPNNPVDSLLVGVGGPLDSVCLDWYAHLTCAFNGESLELPATLRAALMAADSIDSVAKDLAQLFKLMTRANHNNGYTYKVHTTYIQEHVHTTDSVRLDIFYRTNGYYAGDPFYTSDSFVVVNLLRVYALEDNDNVAECGVLDATLGFWLSPLRDSCDASILDSINDRLSIGYSRYPYGELENYLESAPVWVESRRCYVCRIKGVPYLCKVEPVPPYYGG